jgi:hypothetical protein
MPLGHAVALPSQSTTAELSVEHVGHTGGPPLPLPLSSRLLGPHAHAIAIAKMQSALIGAQRTPFTSRVQTLLHHRCRLRLTRTFDRSGLHTAFICVR